MKKRLALLAIAVFSLTVAGCGNKNKDVDSDTEEPTVIVDDTQDDEDDTDDQDIQPNVAEDTEITDEDVKMIEDFLNEVIESVEGDETN